jgi:hypothetical protein
LLFKWQDEDDGSRVAISSNGHVLSHLVFNQNASCKFNSTIIEISMLLQDEHLQDRLSEFARNENLHNGDESREGPHEHASFKDRPLLLLLLILPCATVLLVCGYLAWLKVTCPLATETSTAAVPGTGDKAVHEPYDPRKLPKVRLSSSTSRFVLAVEIGCVSLFPPTKTTSWCSGTVVWCADLI